MPAPAGAPPTPSQRRSRPVKPTDAREVPNNLPPRPRSDHTPPLTPSPSPQYHAGASVTKVVGTSNFPPSFAAVGYAPCFKGFG